MLTALSASLCALMVMKANPLDSPLFQSLIKSVAVMSPALANKAFSSSKVVDLDRFPIHNEASIFFYYFLRDYTGTRNAANPITGSAAQIPHKSSYFIPG
jgi:hypothetical protein